MVSHAQDAVRVCYWNIGGSWADKKEYFEMADNLSLDLICIAEPWIRAPEEVSGLSIKGFTEVISLRSRTFLLRPHGGLILYIREHLFSEVSALNDYMDSPHNGITFKLRNVSYGFVYLPPS